MTDAALSLSIDSAPAAKAAVDLDKLTASAGRSEKGVVEAVRKATDALNNLSSGLAGYSSTIAKALEQAQRPAQQAARSFDDIRASLDPLFASTQRYAKIQDELTAAVKRGEATQDQANRVLAQAQDRYLGVSNAVQAHRDAVNSLKASLDPAYAATMRLEAAEEQLNAAVRAGAISRTEANSVLAVARQQYQGNVAPTEQLVRATNQLSSAQKSASSGSRAFGQTFTQVGYQVQDAAVQLAMGANAMMVIGQQAPQALGVLGMSGPLGVAVAGIATLIAVGSAVAPMLFDMGDKAKKTSDLFGDLAGAVDRYSSSADQSRASVADLTAEFGSQAEAMRGILRLQAELDQQAALRSLRETVKSMTGLSTMAKEMDALIEKAGGFGLLTNEMRGFLRETKLSADQVVTLGQGVDRLGQSKGPEQVTSAARDLLTFLEQAYGTVESMPPSIQALASNLTQAVAESERMTATSNGTAGALDNAANAARGLAQAIATAAGFSANLDQGVHLLEVQLDAVRNKADASAAVAIESLRLEAQANRDRQVASGQLAVIADAQLALDNASIERRQELLGLIRTETEAQAVAGRAAKSGASSAMKQTKELQSLTDSWLKRIQTPTEKYAEQLAEITSLQAAGKLTAEQFARAQNLINEEVREGNPLMEQLSNSFWDFLERGAADFASFKSAMIGGFRTMLVSMIRLAAQNKLVIGVGMGGTGGVAGAASAATGGGGLGGLMQGAGLLGKITGFGSSILSGITAPLQAALSSATSGGIMQGFQSYSTSLSANAAGFNGLGMQIGAYLGPAIAGTAIGGLLAGDYKIAGLGGSTTSMIGAGLGALIGGPLGGLVGGALGGLTNRLFGKRLAGAGIEGKFYGTDGFSGSTYQDYKGGVFGSDSTERQALDKATQDTLSQSFAELRKSVVGMADTLGLAGNTFDDFIYKFRFSTDDKSSEEIAEKFQAKLEDAGHAMADMIAGIDKYAKSGEEALDTLTRLSQSLVGVTSIMDTLGHSFSATGLAGADMASALAELFGGLDAMGTATQTYYNAFYSEEQRRLTLQRQMTEQLDKLDIAMPRTRDAYMAMIEAQDLTTEKGREAYAALIQLAAGMDTVLPAIGSFTEEMAKIAGTIATDLTAAMDGAQQAAQTHAQSSALWYRTAESLRSFLHDLNSSQLAYVSAAQALVGQRSQFDTQLARALAGDNEAAQGLTGSASTLLAGYRQASSSQIDYAMMAAQVVAGVRQAADYAEGQGSTEEKLAKLYEDQLDALTAIRDYLNGTDLMDLGSTLAMLSGTMTSVQGAIIALSPSAIGTSIGTLAASIEALRQAYLAENGQGASNRTYASGDFMSASRITQPEVTQARLVTDATPGMAAAGPATIYTAASPVDASASADLVAEVRSLREENRQLLMAIRSDTSKSAKIAKKWDTIGQPPEQAATGTAA
ncbi:hypothetical protein [Falsirhodobacter sp. 20TX0035]|uniref:hypothetical protein n=1 Tax=Falsirhodobacter sp. 20TX0035 TaxID=3022019 RepID=UPI00232ED0D2|nr:hypothetical protein [Falsirhodobacter sp. 20TX0035]MDB6454682.1 hypothetical protein [Falsirhodobacter sp. 20TX0035]